MSTPRPGGALLPGGGRGGDVDEAGLITPEAVVLGLPVASVGSRGLALIIDLVIQGTTLFVLVFAASRVAVLDGGWVAMAVGLLVVFGVLFVYPVAFETFWRGRTPGKAALGLRVVTVEAAPVGFRHAAIRAALGLIDFYASSGGAAVISALFTRRAQRLGDLAAGTLVIREGRRRGSVTSMRFSAPAGAEGYVEQLDASALDEDDYLAIRSVLVRAQHLPPQTAQPLAHEAMTALIARVTPPPPAGMHPLAVLTCLAAAYQQRHRGRAHGDVADWVWSYDATPPSG